MTQSAFQEILHRLFNGAGIQFETKIPCVLRPKRKYLKALVSVFTSNAARNPPPPINVASKASLHKCMMSFGGNVCVQHHEY